MSRHTTPLQNHKKTPGQMVSDQMGQVTSASGSSPASHMVLNASRSVSDSTAANSKQLLNAYIYEFLVKNTLAETAKSFVAEADIPSVACDQASTKTSPLLVHTSEGDRESGSGGSATTTPQTPAMTVAQFSEEHNIPNLALSMEAPQSFLYEWWQIFWDVYQAKNDRYSSPLASQYHQLQAMRQKQQQDLQGMYMPQMPQQGPVNAAHGPNAAAGMMVPDGHNPMRQAMDPRQQRYMMQMMMKQQQQMPNVQQQHPSQHPQHPQQHPPHVQHSQPQSQHPQSTPLSHQAMQQRTPQPTPQATPQMPAQRPQHLEAQGNMSLNMNIQQPLFMQHANPSANRIQQQAQTQMNNLRQQAAVAQHQPGPPQHQGPMGAMPGPGDMTDANSPNVNGRMNQARPDRAPNMAGMQYPGQHQPHMNMASGPAMSPGSYMPQGSGNNTMGGPPMNQNTNSGRNSNALQDYQMQLMLLEKQNKKRLDIARSNGSDAGLPMQPMSQMPMGQPRKSSSSSSPALKNKPSPTNGKVKKEVAAKKGRKPSGSGAPQSAGSENNVSGNGKASVAIKKEAATPSTPSVTGDANKKRKTPGGDSPRKANKTVGKEKTPKLKKADEPKVEMDDLHKDPGMYFNPNGDEKMMSVDLIENNGAGDTGFFGQPGNGNIDDMDFDFNSFLDGADNGMNGGLGEGLSNFNWGNPIEGD